jgi:4,5-dihydroxyphthalate decarboxylase
MAEPLMLFTLLATFPNTKALKTGAATSPLVNFNFADVKVSNTQFKPLVREQKYDLGELAIVTYLQAKEYGTPYVLLPVVVVGRNQHHTIFHNAGRKPLKASDLTGKRIGVRAYTQTTGCWVRGFLADDYGVDVNRCRWITFEDAHVAQYRDPPIVERASEGKAIKQMLIDGELDAAILGDVQEEGPLKHLIPDHESAGREWASKHGGVPVNHFMVVRGEIAKSRPDIVREVFRLLKESRAAASSVYASGVLDPLRIGIEQNRKSLETIVDYALRQKLLTRRFAVDEFFADAARILGSAAN